MRYIEKLKGVVIHPSAAQNGRVQINQFNFWNTAESGVAKALINHPLCQLRQESRQVRDPARFEVLLDGLASRRSPPADLQ